MNKTDADPLKVIEDGMKSGRSVSRSRLAKLLGVHIATIRNWEGRGLKAVRIGATTYYDWRELWRFFGGGEQKARRGKPDIGPAMDRLRRDGFDV